MRVDLWAVQPGLDDKAELVERAARVCYRSQMSETPENRKKFLESLHKKEHLTVFEHARYAERTRWHRYDSVHEVLWRTRYGTEITETKDFLVVSFNARNVIEQYGINPVFEKLLTLPYLIHTLDDLSDEEKLDHASATFEISGISRACSHQLVRHRVASYSQESQRYVDMSDPEFVVPPGIAENPVARKLFDFAMYTVVWTYKILLSLGVRKEDCRFVLPNAIATRIVVTMTFGNLLHLFGLRCDPAAQWEIRAVATEMLRLIHQKAPTVFGDMYRRYLE